MFAYVPTNYKPPWKSCQLNSTGLLFEWRIIFEGNFQPEPVAGLRCELVPLTYPKRSFYKIILIFVIRHVHNKSRETAAQV